MQKNKNGKQEKWTLESLKEGLDRYYKMHGRYPISREVDEFEFLPTSRSIQRKFGGLMEIRKQLGLNIADFRSGEYSSKRAHKINKRAHKIEKEVYSYLVGIFGVEFVHREYFFTDDKRTRTDFFIYHKGGNFSVDVFFAEDRHNLIGCLNSKMRTYGEDKMIQYPVIFLQMNDSILPEQIAEILKRKKKKLPSYQRVVCIDEFKDFCDTKVPLKVK